MAQTFYNIFWPLGCDKVCSQTGMQPIENSIYLSKLASRYNRKCLFLNAFGMALSGNASLLVRISDTSYACLHTSACIATLAPSNSWELSSTVPFISNHLWLGIVQFTNPERRRSQNWREIMALTKTGGEYSYKKHNSAQLHWRQINYFNGRKSCLNSLLILFLKTLNTTYPDKTTNLELNTPWSKAS